MTKKIEISHKTIIFTVLFLIFLWFLYFIRDIIFQFFLALLIASILNPFVTKLSKYKIPRVASVLVSYLLLLLIIGFVVAAIVPTLVEQTTSFISHLPLIMKNIGISAYVSEQLTQQVMVELGSIPVRVARLTLSLFSNVLSVVAVLVFAFYLLSERQKLEENLGVLIGEKKMQEVVGILNMMETKLGGWARGQLTLMLIVGLFNYIGLKLLGIPFSLPLAVLAGLLEIIPIIGPTLGAAPAVLIGFGISPLLGLSVAALAFLVQQLENYIFVPKVMQKHTGLDPVIILLSLSIGFRLAGIIGILVAIPIYIIIQTIIKEYFIRESK